MLKITKGLIAFLLMSCLLITAIPAFAADSEVAEEIDGYAYLAVDFEGLDAVPFTSNNIDNLSVKDGVINGTSNGGDPFVNYTPGVNFAADSVDYIIIKLAADSVSNALQFFFTTDTIGWSEAASFKYDFSKNVKDANGFVTIMLDTSTCTEWKGTITGIRLDPFSAVGTFALDSIVFWNTDKTVTTVSFANITTAPFGASGDVAQMFVEDGYLYGQSIGGDPYLNFNGAFGVTAANVGAIHFRMKAFSANKELQFFFTTETIGWSEAASFIVDLTKYPMDAFGWIYVQIDTSVCAEWKGTITNFRLDPFKSAGVFKFGSINFDVALNPIPVVPAVPAVIAPPKSTTPSINAGVVLYLFYNNFPIGF